MEQIVSARKGRNEMDPERRHFVTTAFIVCAVVESDRLNANAGVDHVFNASGSDLLGGPGGSTERAGMTDWTPRRAPA
jgi:hypothetical protein